MKLMISRSKNTPSISDDGVRRLRNIHIPQPLYILPRDNLVEEVLIPCLSVCTHFNCMTGFFHSSALKELAPGLAPFIADNDSTMRLLVSPYLSKDDREAIEKGYSEPFNVIEKWLNETYSIWKIDESALIKHTLACLAYLIALDRIKIKVVLVDKGLFHPKVRIFSDSTDTIIAHGSNNVTEAGLIRNVEQVAISKSWGPSDQTTSVNILKAEFESIWDNHNSYHAHSFSFPEAVANNIVREFSQDRTPTFDDFIDAWSSDVNRGEELPLKVYSQKSIEYPLSHTFRIPDYIVYMEGDFAHQGRAIQSWEEAGRNGILEMATGSGKTITALICAHRLFTELEHLLVVVAAPYIPLINQWVKESAKFGIKPIVPGEKGSREKKLTSISRAVRNMNLGVRNIIVLVVTNHMLNDPDFIKIIGGANGSKLLIADEVHNLGTGRFLNSPPEIFNYRLGLSATPIRQYDDVGTEGLFKFFGDVVFQFGLEDAIGTCLVPYNYFLHEISLTDEEVADWLKVTEKLRRIGWSYFKDGDDNNIDDPRILILLNKRRIIIEQAKNKMIMLRRLLSDRIPKNIIHTLIYASDKYREQLNNVNDMLIREFKIRTHQLTAEETASGISPSILLQFALGKLQVITAMRVLDEGVDIPEVSHAYILASTTVKRQWVQRRGRVLRKCSRTDKKKAYIHDFLVLPPISDELKPILSAELSRALEFARLASNGYSEEGAIGVVSGIMDKYHLQ